MFCYNASLHHNYGLLHHRIIYKISLLIIIEFNIQRNQIIKCIVVEYFIRWFSDYTDYFLLAINFCFHRKSLIS